MTAYRLVTLGGVGLFRGSDPVPVDDPRHLALLARLAFAPARTLPTGDLLLTIWPHLTAARGRESLARAAYALASAAGTTLLEDGDGRWTLTGQVACDCDDAPPGAAPMFLEGLTLSDTPEWDEWVAAARGEIAARPVATTRRLPWRWVVAVPALAVVAVAGWSAIRPGPIGDFRPGDRAVLADLRSDPSDSTLARSVLLAAVAGLQQSSRLELYSRPRILQALGSLGRGLGAELTDSLALEVAAHDSIPWVIAIELSAQDDRHRVTTRLLRASTRETVFTASRSATGFLDLIGAVGQTLRALHRRLGEPDDRLRRQPPLDVATSANLEALRSFSDGSDAWRRGQFALARNYWLRAVTLDTGFAMAMGALGAFYYYHHDRANGERYYRDALARRERLTEWEQLNLEERYAGYRGDQDSGLALSRTIAARFPRAGTFYNLGTGLLQASRCEEALEVLEQSRQLDPVNPNTHINIATCHKALRQYDQARAAYLAADRLDSTALVSNNINLEYAQVEVFTGRLAQAESVLTRMTRRPSMADQALGFRGLGYLAFWRGQIARSNRHFRQATAHSRQQRAPTSLLRNLALLALAREAAGDQAGARYTLEEVDSVAAAANLPPGFLVLAAEPLAGEADPARIRALLERMRGRADPRRGDDSAQVAYVSGLLALTEGDPGAALARFGQRVDARFAYRRALALERLGRLDSARAVLAGIVADPQFGWEGQIAWHRALIDIGAIEERLGRPDDAIVSYRRFLQHWAAADPSLPDLVRARDRLAALVGRRDR